MSTANSARNRKSTSLKAGPAKPEPGRFEIPDHAVRAEAIDNAVNAIDQVDLMRALFGAICGLAEFQVSFNQILELSKRGHTAAEILHNDINVFGESIGPSREGRDWQDYPLTAERQRAEVAHG